MRDDSVSMGDMLSHAREAVALLGDQKKASFRSDRVQQLALTRLVEIVGEAAGRVTEPTRKANPGIPWPRIIGMRNRLVHGYDMIDYDVLWDTVKTDLPPLIDALAKIVNK